MTLPLICIALLGILALSTGVMVTVVRGQLNILTGDPADPEHRLTKWVRAHGNTCEYAGILAVMIYILGQTSPSAWVLWCMVITTFCRYLLVLGFVYPKTMAKPNPMRFVGALGTYVCGLALCVALLLHAVSH